MIRRYIGFMGAINSYLKRNRIGELLVSRGKITPQQLKFALSIQREISKPLGYILLAEGMISKWDLRFILATQSTLRVITTVLAIIVGFSGLNSRVASASSIGDIPAALSLTVKENVATKIYSTALFGTGERASTDLSSFTKWNDMFVRFQRDVNNPNAPSIIREWRSDLEPLRGKPLTEMAAGVNRIMNKVQYISDKRNWGRSDYWETPIEFLTRGGDCEDFAIAKYTSLRALGVPDAAMRVAIVKDLQKGIPHAVLIVYTENGAMVLDNQIKQMTKARDIDHYKPIFSINRTAWWIHTDGAGSPTHIATASR